MATKTLTLTQDDFKKMTLAQKMAYWSKAKAEQAKNPIARRGSDTKHEIEIDGRDKPILIGLNPWMSKDGTKSGLSIQVQGLGGQKTALGRWNPFKDISPAGILLMTHPDFVQGLKDFIANNPEPFAEAEEN